MSKNRINKNDEQRQPNIEEIQKETLKVYKETEKILIELITQINKYSKYNNSSNIELLKSEQIKLKNRDLVIAVVGTMKAGKSTTINAIVGQEILPHRVEAMTTLPTLVTHKKNQKIPILHFPKYNILKEFIVDVKKELGSHTEIDQNFKILADDIQNDKLHLQDIYEGKENIFNFLKDINELMRFASTIGIEPPYKDFQNTDDFPRIEVEFYYLKKNKELVDSKFTLMDTPGPNEAKHSQYLGDISKKQTQSASAIILAIDYTQISGESSANIKEQVNEALEYIGKDKVCILLNKFDEDRKQSNEKGYDGARDYFGKEFLGENFTEDRIFPVSSRDAFYANLGLNEIEVNCKIDMKLPWCKEFGVNILGDLWEVDIEDESRVKKMCQIKYKKSYFDKPMKMIIEDSYENSKLDVIVSALTTMEGISKQLNNEFGTKIASLTDDITTLSRQIKATRNDMKLIRNISIDIDNSCKSEIQNIEKTIGKTLNSKLNEFERTITESMNEVNDKLKKGEIEKKKSKIVEKHNKLWSLFGYKFLMKELENKQSKISRETEDKYNQLKEEGKITFDNEEEKKKFIEEIKSEINNILTTFQNKSYSDIEKKINKFIPTLNKKVKNKMEHIIEDVKENLGRNIKFSIPKVTLDNDYVNKNIEFESIIKTIKVEKISLDNQDGFWGSIKRGVDFFDNNWGIDENSYEENNYEITKEDFSSKITSAANNLKANVDIEIKKDFKKKVTEPINQEILKLTKDIESLRSIKEDTLKKRQANEINIKEEISLAEKGNKYLEKINRRLEQTNLMISKGK